MDPKQYSATMAEPTYDYDLFVVGGGSGGLAAAKQAADLGAKAPCHVCPVPKVVNFVVLEEKMQETHT